MEDKDILHNQTHPIHLDETLRTSENMTPSAQEAYLTSIVTSKAFRCLMEARSNTKDMQKPPLLHARVIDMDDVLTYGKLTLNSHRHLNRFIPKNIQ